MQLFSVVHHFISTFLVSKTYTCTTLEKFGPFAWPYLKCYQNTSNSSDSAFFEIAWPTKTRSTYTYITFQMLRFCLFCKCISTASTIGLLWSVTNTQLTYSTHETPVLFPSVHARPHLAVKYYQRMWPYSSLTATKACKSYWFGLLKHLQVYALQTTVDYP